MAVVLYCTPCLHKLRPQLRLPCIIHIGTGAIAVAVHIRISVLVNLQHDLAAGVVRLAELVSRCGLVQRKAIPDLCCYVPTGQHICHCR